MPTITGVVCVTAVLSCGRQVTPIINSDAKVPGVMCDRRRRARYVPDRAVNAGYSWSPTDSLDTG